MSRLNMRLSDILVRIRDPSSSGRWVPQIGEGGWEVWGQDSGEGEDAGVERVRSTVEVGSLPAVESEVEIGRMLERTTAESMYAARASLPGGSRPTSPVTVDTGPLQSESEARVLPILHLPSLDLRLSTLLLPATTPDTLPSLRLLVTSGLLDGVARTLAYLPSPSPPPPVSAHDQGHCLWINAYCAAGSGVWRGCGEVFPFSCWGERPTLPPFPDSGD